MNYAAAAVRLCTALVTFAAGTLAYFVFGAATPPKPSCSAASVSRVLVNAPPRAPQTCRERLRAHLVASATAEQRDRQADDLDDEECYSEAEVLLRDAIRLDPSYEEAYYDLGYLYADLGRFDESVEVLKQGLLLDPDDADLNSELGFSLNALGRSSEALVPLMRDLRAEPTDAFVHSSLSDTHLWSGRHATARDYARKAVALGTENLNEPALDNASLTLLELGRTEPALTAEAESAARKALGVDGESLYANYWLGSILAVQGREDESEAAFEAAADAVPESPFEYVMRGWARLRLGREHEAVEDARHYLQLVEWKGNSAGDAAALAYLALRRDGRETEADALLAEGASRLDSSKFGGKLVACLRGRLAEEKLFAAAKDEFELTAAHGYVGLKYALDRDTGGLVQAVRNVEWVRANGTRQFTPYAVVLDERKQLLLNN